MKKVPDFPFVALRNNFKFALLAHSAPITPEIMTSEFYSREDEESRNKYKELKNLFERALSEIRKGIETKQAKGLLIEVQNSMKGLKLHREDRNDIYSRLQEAFTDVNEKIAAERDSFEKEALSNYAEIKILVEEAAFVASHPKDFHETWDFLIEVQTRFKSVKLLREHREELYQHLQHAFTTLKAFQAKEKSLETNTSTVTYAAILPQVEEILEQIPFSEDPSEIKETLIQLQRSIRESKMVREHRTVVEGKIQEAFLLLQVRKEEEQSKLSQDSLKALQNYRPRLQELLATCEETTEFHELREQLKSIQAEIRDRKLLREHREELTELLQLSFSTLSERQNKKNEATHEDQKRNYDKLKALVDQGFSLAEESTKYKETREFLKKIQSEFKGLKLSPDNREELYSRLQTAFTILNRRIDEFFREKKKNWMLKMQYKFTESTSEVYMLEKSIEKDQIYLDELTDQLEIVTLSGKENEVTEGLRSRINSTVKSIERKQAEIRSLEQKMTELRERIDPSEEEA
jgi:hypothetical protein